MKECLIFFAGPALLPVANRLHAQGTLLATFTNPASIAINCFGNAMAAVDKDQGVLIGIVGDSGGTPDAASPQPI